MALLLLIRRVQRLNVKTARRRYAKESSGQLGYNHLEGNKLYNI